MATQEQIRQFFSLRKNKPKIARIGGKFSFKDMPKEVQNEIKQRLAEKDPVINAGLKGELPGLKIDGKVVTRENIHEFEIKPNKKESASIKVESTSIDLSKMTKDELEYYALKKFKVNLDKRKNKDKLIEEIKKLEGN